VDLEGGTGESVIVFMGQLYSIVLKKVYHLNYLCITLMVALGL